MKIRFSLCIIHLLLFSFIANANEQEKLLERVDRVRAPSNNFTFRVQTTPTNGQTLHMEVAIKDRTKGLVRYVEPFSLKGRKILFIENNMWAYVPGSRRALRVSPMQRLTGGASNADIARVIFSLDYTIENIEPSGEDQVLQLVAKNNAMYSRVDLTISKNVAPKLAIYYSSNGKRKIKSLYFEDYQLVLGIQRPMQLRIVDHLSGDEETVLQYSDFTLANTPDAWFQPGYLNR